MARIFMLFLSKSQEVMLFLLIHLFIFYAHPKAHIELTPKSLCQTTPSNIEETKPAKTCNTICVVVLYEIPMFLVPPF